MANCKNLSRFEGSVHTLFVSNKQFVQGGNSFWFKIGNTYENVTCRFLVFCVFNTRKMASLISNSQKKKKNTNFFNKSTECSFYDNHQGRRDGKKPFF